VKLIRSLNNFSTELRGGVVSVGNFDGVHLGHRALVARLRSMAAEVRGPIIVFTFDPHPVRLLRPLDAPPPLTWTDRKAELLAELGVDVMLTYPTDERLLDLTARQFFDQILRGILGARGLVEGPNFYFGKGRSGNIDVLQKFCGETGVRLDIVEPKEYGGETVSSSRVRMLIGRGDVGTARRLLERPYRIRGIVTHGAARGNRIGFPTANLEGIDTLCPAPGVYAACTSIDNRFWPAAVNLGTNPTFGEHVLKIEVHLVGFSGDLYGRTITVDFLERLRDIHPFRSVEDLKTQLSHDVAKTTEIAHALHL